MNDISQPKVSILIPLYNQKRYFKDCMRSVCEQTYKNLEIIVVNDGSTDNSPKMAKDWSYRDNRVKVIDKQNEGLAFARRDGYLAATGDLITFLDSDDMLAPRAIEILLANMLEKDVDLVMGLCDKKLGFIHQRMSDKGYSFPFNQVIGNPELFDKYYIGFFNNTVFSQSVWGKLYRKSVIDKAYQETELYSPDIRFMGEDQYFNLKLFPFLRSVYRIDETVYIYRYGGGTFGFNRNFPQLFDSSDKRLKLLDQYNYTDGYEPLFAEYVACFYHHAAQLIHFRKADKAGVIDFFKQEILKRELMPRLTEFYNNHGSDRRTVRLLLDRDYEGMYQFAIEESEKLYGSMSYKAKKFIVELLTRIF
jgi:glycosyltransferase involved in cell wall biosynthesis